jgi:hypothetical protein
MALVRCSITIVRRLCVTGKAYNLFISGPVACLSQQISSPEKNIRGLRTSSCAVWPSSSVVGIEGHLPLGSEIMAKTASASSYAFKTSGHQISLRPPRGETKWKSAVLLDCFVVVFGKTLSTNGRAKPADRQSMAGGSTEIGTYYSLHRMISTYITI